MSLSLTFVLVGVSWFLRDFKIGTLELNWKIVNVCNLSMKAIEKGGHSHFHGLGK